MILFPVLQVIRGLGRWMRLPMNTRRKTTDLEIELGILETHVYIINA